MKWNCYDLLDYYNTEKNDMPALKTQPIQTDAVLERVQRQTGCLSAKPERKFHRTRWVAGAVAAVVLVTGGTMLSAAAGYGGLDAFFQSLTGDVTPHHPEKMASLVTTPDSSFDSTNAAVQFRLLGMYGDDNQALLSFQVSAQGDAGLKDGLQVRYQLSLQDENGSAQPLDSFGRTVSLRETDGAYYVNLRIDQTDLQGKTLDVTFENFYTEAQVTQVWNQVQAYNDQMRQDYIRQTLGEDALQGLEDGALPAAFDLNAWKTYWQEQNLDQKCADKEQALYAASDCAVAGSWHTNVVLHFTSAEPITAYTEGCTVTLQTLSASVAVPESWEDSEHFAAYVITLKDGRKIFDELMANDDGTEALSRIHTLPGCETDTLEQYVPLETVYVDDNNASVLCYSEPIDPDTVASITAYRYTYLGDAASDASGIGGYELTDTTVIYQG